MKKQKPKVGDYFYIVANDGRFLKKINFISGKIFEWGKIYKTPFGWGEVKELIPNPNTGSKVKWIKNERRSK